jgi:hypothetical protein
MPNGRFRGSRQCGRDLKDTASLSVSTPCGASSWLKNRSVHPILLFPQIQMRRSGQVNPNHESRLMRLPHVAYERALRRAVTAESTLSRPSKGFLDRTLPIGTRLAGRAAERGEREPVRLTSVNSAARLHGHALPIVRTPPRPQVSARAAP